MTRLGSRRGGALFMALALVAVIALVAASLARITHGRALVFSDARNAQYAAQAGRSAFNETRSCLVAAGLPAPSAVAQMRACGLKTAPAGVAERVIDLTVNNRSYRVTLTYRVDGKKQPAFEVQADEL